MVSTEGRLKADVGVRGREDEVLVREREVGSEARESMMPEILKRSDPRILRRAKIIGKSGAL